ncbi:MAG TPA: TSUP family transporter [Solirubrobacteraceae bacterium]|nr:TSUP family transporter [Solirubrobacteraceae bacterium]
MIEVATIGVLAGLVSGLLGVGGGILFVPGLVFVIGLSQVDAEATSLLAIVPVVMLGAWQQHRYGNVRVRDGVLIGLLAVVGSVAGVAVANIVDGRTLRLAFAGVTLVVAAQLVRGAVSSSRPDPAEPESP